MGSALVDARGVEGLTAGPSPVRRLSFTLFSAYAASIAVYNGISSILLPAAVQAIDPAHKVSILATATTLSAILTVIALVLGGAISDRTRSRWGRRTPMIVVCCAISAVIVPLTGLAHSRNQLFILVPLVWFVLAFYQVALTAMLPDRIPADHRGVVAAAMALGAPVGILVGVNIAAFAPTHLLGYGALVLLLIIATSSLVYFTPEESSLDMDRGAGNASLKVDLFGMLNGFRERNFTLAFLSRFLLFIAFFTISGYLYYLVQDYIGTKNLPGQSASTAVSVMMTTITMSWILITPVTGFLADRFRHTPLIVGLSSIGIGASMLVPFLSHNWLAMLVLALGMGLSFGIYFATDLKLLTLVLPNPETAGRDIGVLSVATSAPQIMTPAIAGAVIALGGYQALFVFGGAAAIVGGISALFIRLRF